MSRHVNETRLQDFREGLLAPEEEERVRAHLDECPMCREELETLSVLAEGLRGLPLEAQPSRDLWPQIAWRLEGGTEKSPSGGKRHWVRMPVWQLMAASLAIALMSGGAVWMFLSGGSPTHDPAGGASASFAQPAGWEGTLREYDEAVSDLEAVLEQGRELLDGETVRILEENLETIDTAIREAAEALDRDPGSGLLQRFLSENLRRKVDLLRVAATAVYANT